MKWRSYQKKTTTIDSLGCDNCRDDAQDFYGGCPSVLLVHLPEETGSLHTVINKLVKLLTTMGDLDVLMYKEDTFVQPKEFLTRR